MNIEEKARKIVIQVLGDKNEIKPESRFIEDLDADSLDIVELPIELEQEFVIEITDEDMEKIRTFKELVDYLEKKQQKEPILQTKESSAPIRPEP